MTIEVACRCGQRFNCPPEYAGRTLPCPACGGPIAIPIPRQEPTEFCDFCHQWIPRSQMSAHIAEHTQLEPDGQYKDYATLPLDERAHEKELADVPKWYKHLKCGEVTGMPDEIIQTYLANPWFYISDRTFCTGCGKHVRQRECVWEETGENLQTYCDRLRAAKPEFKPSLYIRAMVWVMSAFQR
jgi:hypothetical protein